MIIFDGYKHETVKFNLKNGQLLKNNFSKKKKCVAIKNAFERIFFYGSMSKLTESQKLLKELKILNIQQLSYEKECKILHDNFQPKQPEFCNGVFELNRKMVGQRDKTHTLLNSKTEDIRRHIFRAKHCIDNFEPDTNSNEEIEGLRKLMESISINTEKLKSSQAVSYEHLMNEFSVYESELQALEKRLVYDTSQMNGKFNSNNRFNKGLKSKYSGNNNQNSNQSTNPQKLPDEVTEYQNFLVLNGGLTGGWDDFDHSHFIKLYRKHVTNPDKWLQECLISLPNKTIEAIKLHRIWYERFQELLEANKKAIIRWKRGKSLTIKMNTEKNKSNSGEQDLAEIKLQDYKIKLKKQKDREKALAWREAKNVEKEEQEREKRDLEIAIQTQKLESFKRQQRNKQIEVDLYKAEKMAKKADRLEAEVKLIEEARQRRKEEVKEGFYHFQSKDVRFVRGKLEKKKLEEVEKEEKRIRLERTKSAVARPKAERDFDRLTRPTTSSRRREEADKESAGCVVGARVMPSRAVPSWRKNM